MTEFEKRIYNCWLATTRKKTNRPFKLRKKWDKFEEKTDYMSIKKLAKLFARYDNINIDDWFTAPYIIYPEKIEYSLKDYTLMKQYNVYRLYLQKKNNKKYTPQEFKKLLIKNNS